MSSGEVATAQAEEERQAEKVLIQYAFRRNGRIRRIFWNPTYWQIADGTVGHYLTT